jgi:hypothetical protein
MYTYQVVNIDCIIIITEDATFASCNVISEDA